MKLIPEYEEEKLKNVRGHGWNGKCSGCSRNSWESTFNGKLIVCSQCSKVETLQTSFHCTCVSTDQCIEAIHQVRYCCQCDGMVFIGGNLAEQALCPHCARFNYFY